jgi:predicted phosphohydrolase
MSVYAIADLHLSFGADKSMDVFTGWGNYVEKIKKNWENTIKKEDTVIIAGDISWAMRLEDSKKDFEFINDLPGKKILIKGNHDYWWSTAAKINNFLKENSFNNISILFNNAYPVGNICVCGTRGWLYNSDSVEDEKILSREVGRLRCSLDMAKQYDLEPVVFLHYPPVYGKEESEEIINLLIERKAKKCYYGHIHGNAFKRNIVEGDYKGVCFKLISCDYINFCPVLVA